MPREKLYSKEEVDIKTLSNQIISLQKSFDEFTTEQKNQEQKQEEKITVLEKAIEKRDAYELFRRVEARLMYAGCSALLAWLILR